MNSLSGTIFLKSIYTSNMIKDVKQILNY